MNMIQEGRIVLHNHSEQLDKQFRMLEESTGLESNKQAIRDFINHCMVVEGIEKSTLKKYVFALRKVLSLSNKPFKKLTEKDITDILAKIDNGNIKAYSEHTKADFRKAIGKFWRWLYYDEYMGEAPPSIRRIKSGVKNGHREPVIYTKEEIKKLIESMNTIRDKAFFSCLYDLECRVSELLTRRMKDVRYTEDGDIQVFVEADKTNNSHWETLFESVSYFTTWLRLHPDKDNQGAPLWTMHRKKGEILSLSYPAVRSIFIKTCKRHNIRRLKIHTLRKSKATHDLADGVPITYIEARGSWSKGSRALQNCYLSVQQKDKDNAYKKKYNMAVNGDQKDVKELKRCVRCEAVMESLAKFCVRCGMPADMKVAIEFNEIEKKLPQYIDAEMLSELVKKVVMEELKKKL